jgi:hypothetical protein
MYEYELMSLEWTFPNGPFASVQTFSRGVDKEKEKGSQWNGNGRKTKIGRIGTLICQKEIFYQYGYGLEGHSGIQIILFTSYV